jgi:hypothetical protein
VIPSVLLAALVIGSSAFAAGSRCVASPQLAQQPTSEGEPATIPEMWGAWCARCHADDGSGKMKEPTITVVPMDFTDCKLATAEPDADWERATAKGGAGFVAHMRGFGKETGWRRRSPGSPWV